jgi:hypothetical protein
LTVSFSQSLRHERRQRLLEVPGLAAFWDFVEREDGPAGVGRFAAVAEGASGPVYPLDPVNLAPSYWGQGEPGRMEDFPTVGHGPFGQAVRLTPTGSPDRLLTLMVPRARMHDTPLDVKGPGRSVSVLVWLRYRSGNHAIAGVWHEGTDLPVDDPPTRVERGRRQYGLFAGLAAGPGVVSAHLSENGEASFGDRYARHMAATRRRMPTATDEDPDTPWSVAGFVYDNQRRDVTAYLDGVADTRWVDRPAQQHFYQHAYRAWCAAEPLSPLHDQLAAEGAIPPEARYSPPQDQPIRRHVIRDDPAETVVEETFAYTKVRTVYHMQSDGQPHAVSRDLVALKVNPYWFGHDLYAPPSVEVGGPFTIGRVILSQREAGDMEMTLGGVAVYGRALRPREMADLSTIGRPDGKGPISLHAADLA